MSRKKIKKDLFASLYDWLIGYYSFNFSLVLKTIIPVHDFHVIKVASTLLLCQELNWSIM